MTDTEKEHEGYATPDETNAERFKRIASPRLTKVVKAIRVLGNCAGHGYESTPEQHDTIEAVLLEEVNKLMKKFRKREEDGDVSIEL